MLRSTTFCRSDTSAKHAFLHIAWILDVESDVDFVMSCYFHRDVFEPEAIAGQESDHKAVRLQGVLHQVKQQNRPHKSLDAT